MDCLCAQSLRESATLACTLAEWRGRNPGRSRPGGRQIGRTSTPSTAMSMFHVKHGSTHEGRGATARSRRSGAGTPVTDRAANHPLCQCQMFQIRDHQPRSVIPPLIPRLKRRCVSSQMPWSTTGLCTTARACTGHPPSANHMPGSVTHTAVAHRPTRPSASRGQALHCSVPKSHRKST